MYGLVLADPTEIFAGRKKGMGSGHSKVEEDRRRVEDIFER